MLQNAGMTLLQPTLSHRKISLHQHWAILARNSQSLTSFNETVAKVGVYNESTKKKGMYEMFGLEIKP